VTNKSANSFEVRELGGGASNVRFDYRITAMRRKYETVVVLSSDRKSPPRSRRGSPDYDIWRCTCYACRSNS
jgi:hypothetical protein